MKKLMIEEPENQSDSEEFEMERFLSICYGDPNQVIVQVSLLHWDHRSKQKETFPSQTPRSRTDFLALHHQLLR
ncbi:unnamed protein product [Trifolium pratense]|uniref:Uncharacterized protein n=1 Tax=Trifolium pratense TaxID=57577 RepID=A0ACB0KLD1_TRIPR|nr:unnamed protein product [Trifolium pratense]